MYNYSVKRLTQCLVEPLMQDWIALKRTVRYVLGRTSLVMRYEVREDFLETEVAAGWAGCVRTPRSTP